MYVNFALKLVMRAFVMMAMIPHIYVYLFIHCSFEISTARISLDMSGLSLRPKLAQGEHERIICHFN